MTKWIGEGNKSRKGASSTLRQASALVALGGARADRLSPMALVALSQELEDVQDDGSGVVGFPQIEKLRG